MFPEEHSTYANRAQAYIKLKQFSKAIGDADKAIEIDEKYVKGYFRRAMAYKGCEKYEESILDFQTLLELEPKNKQANSELLAVRQKLDLKKMKEEKKRVHMEEGDKVVEVTDSDPVIEDEDRPKPKAKKMVIEEVTSEDLKKEEGKKGEESKKV